MIRIELHKNRIRIGSWIYCRCMVCKKITRFRVGTGGLLICSRRECWDKVIDRKTGLLVKKNEL